MSYRVAVQTKDNVVSVAAAYEAGAEKRCNEIYEKIVSLVFSD